MNIVTIQVRFPWWWRLYLDALLLSAYCGVLRIDAAVATEFILRHTRIRVVS